jgi:cystathionine beta-lyase
VVTAGRDPASYHGFVNPPVFHASTVLYPSAEDFVAHRSRYQYGRRGTPTTEALELALQELDGPQCAGVSLLPSGLAAISAALLAVVHAGDHVLVTDSAYGPTRNFCEQILSRLGVTTGYFDPHIGAAIGAQLRPNTRAIFLESPGSLTFEMQDTAAIAKAAHANGTLVLMDNTWATPLYFRPLEHGVDLAIQAGTKYIGGHSDVMLGTVSANAETVARLKTTVRLTGLCEGPDDVYLALRGLRTLSVRLERHCKSGLAVARWLEARPEVLRLLHPGLPSHPGHAIWKRDFSGASGLFSMVLKPVPRKAVYAFLDTLELFGIGASWGGYESLAIPFDCAPLRTATAWAPGGPTVRFHIGLEDVADLFEDLERGFAALAAAA